jgi:hypothetical protein
LRVSLASISCTAASSSSSFSASFLSDISASALLSSVSKALSSLPSSESAKLVSSSADADASSLPVSLALPPGGLLAIPVFDYIYVFMFSVTTATRDNHKGATFHSIIKLICSNNAMLKYNCILRVFYDN